MTLRNVGYFYRLRLELFQEPATKNQTSNVKHEIKIENCLYNVDNVANERTAVCVLFTSYLYCKPGRQYTVAPLVAAISPFMSLISVISEVTTVVMVDQANGETCPTLFEQ